MPTEWEWQAVADYDGSYTYGCGITISKSKANYYDAGYANPLGLTSYPYTSPVGYYPAYGYGMCDMAGNANEWMADGGSWASYHSYCIVSYRDFVYAYYHLGFRVCR